MKEYTFKTNKQKRHLNIDINGSLTVSNIKGFYDKLKSSIQDVSEIRINLLNMESIDISAIQLIYQLKRYCGNEQIDMTLNASLDENTQNLLQVNGIKIFNS